MKSVWAGSMLLSTMLMAAAAFGQGVPPLPAGVDLSGAWFPITHQDSGLGTAAGMIADWGGIPMNEAARIYGLSWSASRISRTGASGGASNDTTKGADHQAKSVPAAEAMVASKALSARIS